MSVKWSKNKQTAALHNFLTHGGLWSFGWIISIVLLNWVKSECRDARPAILVIGSLRVDLISVHLKPNQNRWSVNRGNLVKDQEISWTLTSFRALTGVGGCGVFRRVSDKQTVFLFLYPAQQLGDGVDGTGFCDKGAEARVQLEFTRDLEWEIDLTCFGQLVINLRIFSRTPPNNQSQCDSIWSKVRNPNLHNLHLQILTAAQRP